MIIFSKVRTKLGRSGGRPASKRGFRGMTGEPKINDKTKAAGIRAEVQQNAVKLSGKPNIRIWGGGPPPVGIEGFTSRSSHCSKYFAFARRDARRYFENDNKSQRQHIPSINILIFQHLGV